MDTNDLGVSLRLIRDWEPGHISRSALRVDVAIWLTSKDPRDVSFETKLADALEYLGLHPELLPQ